MNERNGPTNEKRPRGRPKGSAPFAERDHAALSRFADQELVSPGGRLAPFLQRQGYEEKDIRRAQARWRKEKDKLLQEAQQRADLNPAELFLQFVMDIYATIGAAAESVKPALRMIAASQGRALRRQHAREQAGTRLELPVDLENKAAVDAAIERYEETMFQPEDVRLARLDQQTLHDLSPSQKLYATAIMLHDLSLQNSDDRQDDTGADDASPQEHDEDGR